MGIDCGGGGPVLCKEAQDIGYITGTNDLKHGEVAATGLDTTMVYLETTDIDAAKEFVRDVVESGIVSDPSGTGVVYSQGWHFGFVHVTAIDQEKLKRAKHDKEGDECERIAERALNSLVNYIRAIEHDYDRPHKAVGLRRSAVEVLGLTNLAKELERATDSEPRCGIRITDC